MPVQLASFIPLFYKGVKCAPNRSLLVAPLFYLVAFSLLAHKEFRCAVPSFHLFISFSESSLINFRFLLPILPFILIYCGVGLRELVLQSRRRLIALLFTVQLVILLYLSLVHQSGTISAMESVRMDPSVHSLYIITPCHATPFYSAVHRPIAMDFLQCPPKYVFFCFLNSSSR